MLGVPTDAGEPLAMTDLERRNADALWFLESLDRVSRAIGASRDFDQLVSAVLAVALELFDGHRVLLASTSSDVCWPVVKEQSRAGHTELLEHPRCDQLFVPRNTSSHSAIVLGAAGSPLLPEVAETIGASALMAVALAPEGAEPYALILHNATATQRWTVIERRLFEELGRRLTEALTHALTLRTLRQSERRLDAAQRLAHVGYWERDFEAHQITLSDESCQIFGFSPDERIVDLPRWHARWVSLIHPEDQQSTADAFAAAVNGKADYDVEYRVVRPSGEIRVILLNTDRLEPFEVHAGDRIAQLLFLPVTEATLSVSDDLEDTHRGGRGFGSSGR